MQRKMELRFLLDEPQLASSSSQSFPRPSSSSQPSSSSSHLPSSSSSRPDHSPCDDKAIAADAILELSRSMSNMLRPETLPAPSSFRPPRSRSRSRSVRHKYPPASKPRTHFCGCTASFNKKEHLKRHIRMVHHVIRPYSCKVCSLHFGTKQNMQVHFTTRKHRQRALFSGPP